MLFFEVETVLETRGNVVCDGVIVNGCVDFIHESDVTCIVETSCPPPLHTHTHTYTHSRALVWLPRAITVAPKPLNAQCIVNLRKGWRGQEKLGSSGYIPRCSGYVRNNIRHIPRC